MNGSSEQARACESLHEQSRLARLNEYPSPTRLEGVSKRFVKIPESIICENGIGEKLVTTFSFFSIKKGLDDKVMFSVNGLVEWSNKTPNRSARGVNASFANTIGFLEKGNWLLPEKKMTTGDKCCVASINMDKLDDECNDTGKRFAIVYIDEVEKILAWQNPNPKDAYMSNDLILRVFAYVRMLVVRRRNRVEPGLTVQERKEKWPEVWNGYYDEMAEELGITPRAFSSAVKVLCDMSLLYTEALPRVKVDSRWVTSQTLFCNTYKREGDMILASGRDYYMEEIENKKKKLIKYRNCN